MSSITNKNTGNARSVQPVPIDEIINKVASYEYSDEIKTTGKYSDQGKTTKPDSIALMHKDKLLKLLIIINKLKGAVLTDESSLQIKINELFQLLKNKLGNDLYLFSIGAIVKFLPPIKGTSAKKLDRSIETLFGEILTDVELELRNKLSNGEFIVLENVFVNDTESNLLQIIQSIESEKAIDNNAARSKNISLIYIYVVLKNRNRSDFYKHLLTVERVLAECLADLAPEEESKYLHNILPDTLLDSNPKTKIRSFVYLYCASYNQLKQRVDFLSDKLKESRNHASILSGQVQQLTEQGKEKDRIISELKQLAEEKDETINKQQIKINERDGLLQYEINKYETQLKGLKNGLTSKFRRLTQTELEGITAISETLPQEQSTRLNLYILKINQILDTLL